MQEKNLAGGGEKESGKKENRQGFREAEKACEKEGIFRSGEFFPPHLVPNRTSGPLQAETLNKSRQDLLR